MNKVIAFVMLVISYSACASDVYCGFRFNTGGTTPVINPSPDYSTPLSVGEDLPAGSIIFWKTVSLGDRFYAECNDFNSRGLKQVFPDTFQDQVAVNAGVISAPLGGAGSDKIYPTGVYGIGVKVSIAGYDDTVNNKVLTSISGNGTGGLSGAPVLNFSLIKTVSGAVGTGTINASDFPVLSLEYFFLNNPQLKADFSGFQVKGIFNVIGGTCKVDSVDVNLGSHKGSEFTGIGSTSEWKDFSIKMTDCPTFYGNQIAGGTSNSLGLKSQLTLTLECPTPVTANGEDACETDLLPSGESTGLGVEIFDVTLNWSVFYMGNTTWPVYKYGSELLNAGSVIDFPFKARYRQTRNQINGGPANLSMQFTITYE
ncbi:fimbrial protein [Enterobacter hormaechei]|uniref:fimbrial protein n=1 Tax=Enterobacter hormaechei TaxID=158836 RepID=UPI0026E2A079|nr:fimbrial protein [Enterobacter hormaechei]MDO6168687.1 fimbrial protein [Enterobacter hormaechei]MDO6172974.1 fimbrial protein [Enterobacter hormaechei]